MSSTESVVEADLEAMTDDIPSEEEIEGMMEEAKKRVNNGGV